MNLDNVIYPAIAPYASGHLDVGDGHRIYWEQDGNPNGVPLLVLHGGPGAGLSATAARYYDPSFWRIVMLDQRGCGRSTPYASIEANTTHHLIADLEKLRSSLGIDRWAVAGGSWGSFLSLAYAQAHADRVRALLLRGIFTGRTIERIWWWDDGTRWLFPDRWQALRDFLPEAERDTLLKSYYRRLCDPDPAVHMPAAVTLRTYSGWTNAFRATEAHVRELAQPAKALTLARIFTHYCMNGFFVAEGALLANIGAMRHLKGIIVQARYDVVTPARTAWELAQAWPNAALTIVNDGNHATDEPDMAQALIEAQERLKSLV